MTFEHGENEGEEVSIRTFIIDDLEDVDEWGRKREKPTLVMVHGYAAAMVQFYTILRPLMYHYRIVGIDQLGFGASSRVTLSEEFTKDLEAIDEFQVSWLEKWVNVMT